ncbi:MAG: FkbM family methyltransferase [Okeania sp. SIO3C4]|nr:FkbM family methyltransferase [Okeania sp. SIO3C4]
MTITLPTGLKYICPTWDPCASEVCYTNCDVDIGSEALLYKLLPEGSAFVDVGAHTGYYSLYMLPRASAAYAFEPDKKSVEYLKKNFAMHPKAQAVAKAVHSSSGTFQLVERGYGFSYLAEVAAEQYLANPAGMIEATSLDDFFADRNDIVGAIKIDIDGSDLEVIRGAKAIISRDKPYILTELLSQQFKELAEFLEELDYSAFAYMIHEKPKRFKQLEIGQDYSKDVKMLLLAPVSQTKAIFKAVNV